MAESAFTQDWLVLRRVGGPAIPMVASANVARTLRRALMSHCPDEPPEILSGHRSDGSPSERDHLAIVPLPFVGHAHATGSILGVALILPRDVSSEDRLGVYAAVDAWERSARQEDEDTPRLPLRLGPAGVLELERVEWAPVQSSLRASTWCKSAHVWDSATPVALDHNPGDLRSRDSRKLSKAIEEATETINRAVARIGLPTPAAVEILPAAPLAGATKASKYPAYPELPGRTRRVLTHVQLTFGQLVRGPILLGAGRYHGLGLFRPQVIRE
jgi:CRISPR-associated protein Csb2